MIWLSGLLFLARPLDQQLILGALILASMHRGSDEADNPSVGRMVLLSVMMYWWSAVLFLGGCRWFHGRAKNGWTIWRHHAGAHQSSGKVRAFGHYFVWLRSRAADWELWFCERRKKMIERWQQSLPFFPNLVYISCETKFSLKSIQTCEPIIARSLTLFFFAVLFKLLAKLRIAHSGLCKSVYLTKDLA